MLKYPSPKYSGSKNEHLKQSPNPNNNTFPQSQECSSFQHPMQMQPRYIYPHDYPTYPDSFPSYMQTPSVKQPSNHREEGYGLSEPVMYEYMNIRDRYQQEYKLPSSQNPYPHEYDISSSIKSSNHTEYATYTHQPPNDYMSYSTHPPISSYSDKKENISTSYPLSIAQQAVIKVKTVLKTKYYRNARRNIQCFPTCKVFGDYSSIKIEDLKQHDFMWGKCRGSVLTEITFMGNIELENVWILGRVHSIEKHLTPFEELVIRECMLGQMIEMERMEAMKEEWMIGEHLPDFVQENKKTGYFEFKPRVWKYQEDLTQGKRRNVLYYIQIEAFVEVKMGAREYCACIGSGMSTPFEVGSSRVLTRQKRKAAGVLGNTNATASEIHGQPPVAGYDEEHSAMHADSQSVGGMQMPSQSIIRPDHSQYHTVHHEEMYANYPSRNYSTLNQTHVNPISEPIESVHHLYQPQQYTYPSPQQNLYPSQQYPYQSAQYSSVVGEKRIYNDSTASHNERASKTPKT